MPGSPNCDPAATTARLWQHDLASGTKRVAAKVNQSADEGPLDEDANPSEGALGAWESSGIVDASSVFGPGAFLIDVQAGTFVITEEVQVWRDRTPSRTSATAASSACCASPARRGWSDSGAGVAAVAAPVSSVSATPFGSRTIAARRPTSSSVSPASTSRSSSSSLPSSHAHSTA